MKQPIRILIADDHAILRDGLKQMFSLYEHLTVVGETTNGNDTLDRLAQKDIDLLILDLTMPGRSGEDLISRIHGTYPKLPILVLTMHHEVQIAKRALAAGASGYLTKDSDVGVLLAAVEKVAAGGHSVDHAIAEKMAFVPPEGPCLDDLSDREFQVLRLFGGGATVVEIARQLSISDKTVSTHKARLMAKMGFASNADLIKYAIAQGLVT